MMKKIIVFLYVMSGCVFALVAAADEDMLLEDESLNVYESREADFNCAQELQRAAVLDFFSRKIFQKLQI